MNHKINTQQYATIRRKAFKCELRGVITVCEELLKSGEKDFKSLASTNFAIRAA